MSRQSEIEHTIDKHLIGELSADQANVNLVRAEGVRIVRGRVPAQVRKALNAAVKIGELGHLKKDGLMPECYFNPNARSRAIEERRAMAMRSVNAIAGVLS